MISLEPSSRTGIYLSSYTKGRDNNFTLLRFVAATAVLISHSFILSTGRVEAEPLVSILGTSFGPMAVDVFFVASGFLVTGSLLYRQSLRDFIAARALRIYPGLWVALILTVVLVGFFITTLSLGEYFGNAKTWEYFARNGVLVTRVAHQLPGAFGDVPYNASVNGSLWTLPKEVRMYAALVGLWLLAKLIRVNAVRFLSGACVVVAVLCLSYDLVLFARNDPDEVLYRLGAMFFLGASLRVFQNRIPISRLLAWSLFGVVVLSPLVGQQVFGVIYRLAVPYLVIYFAFVPGGFIRRFNAFGDYSYGIYIYAFPVQQATAHFWRGVGPYEMLGTSFVFTLILAMGSWHLIESRALSLKDRFIKKVEAVPMAVPVG